MTRTDRSINRRTKTAVWPKWLTGFMLALGILMLAAPVARAETRTLKLYFVHTKERAEITFKRNGRYDQAGLKKINMFLRDWRRNEPTKMDPRLLDLVWETYRAAGASDYIHVVSAYRSPATNSMLRKRSKGVANKSQHMLGKAMDFYIPGVSLKKLRDTGLRMQTGGVGYYPRSGSPFVHLDVGNVRHWPRMSRKELAAVFPNGKTLHVPSDGKPLPGFETALASYETRKKNGTTALALASSPSSKSSKSGGLLSALFGGGADEEEDNGASEESVAAAPAARTPKPSGDIQIVPPELANPASVPAGEEEVDQTPETIIAALPVRDIPLPIFAPRPQADVGPVGSVNPAEPDSVPFGMAAEILPEDGGDEIGEEADAAIPLPTWRPDLQDGSALVALAAVQPESRSDIEEAAASGLSTSQPGDIAAAVEENEQRLAVLSNADGLDEAVDVLSKQARLSASPAKVKTTGKSDRAQSGASKPAPKPLVVAAQPESARWALETETQLAYAAGGPSVAHLRSVPSEVYATGFQRNTVVADAGRFTGKAISFMPVARFQTN
ncbi:DUF882 domain-containing protein [Mesorhizobium sp. KR9-304]|uniref:DUF882 domain-containing protein n=1 Tax=Mesorhizobium sp. KR9-304 TaxID=3156614 RepID=UPI0032B367EF